MSTRQAISPMSVASAQPTGGPDAEQRSGTVLMVLAGLILGTMGVFVIEAGQDPITTVAFRCVFGLMALSVWGAMQRRGRELRLRGRALLGAMLTGVLMATSWGLHFAAIPRTSIGVSTVVFHIQPFWTMALGAWLLHEKVSARQVGMAALAFAGLALATGLFDAGIRAGSDGGALSRDHVIGLALSLAGSLVYAFVPLLAKVLKTVSAFALVWWQCLVGAVLTIWWPPLHGWPLGLDSLAWLVGLGAIHSGLAYALMFAGFARLSTGRIAVLQFVYPFTAFAFDWAVYGHTLSALQVAGLGLMGAAIWSVKRGR